MSDWVSDLDVRKRLNSDSTQRSNGDDQATNNIASFRISSPVSLRVHTGFYTCVFMCVFQSHL